MIDLSEYATRIFDDADKPIFQEAIECGKANAKRAAYVMVWISCAESLKRRFREAAKRDGDARKIVGEIERKEKDHKAVDKYLLDEGKEYGLLSDSSYALLLHVYEMRCVYGHPYEAGPSDEQVIHAAAVAVDELLKHPVRLRHGFCDSLLKSLLEEKSFLDDKREAVELFTTEIVPRIDETVVGWMFEKYMKELEAIADDSSIKVFFQRGVWFCRTVLSKVGTGFFSHDEWHSRATAYPKALLRICCKETIFKDIGERAGTTLVGKALELSTARPTILRALERLNAEGALNDRQEERFYVHLLSLADSSKGARTLRASRLGTKICYNALIAALKSHDWYIQNPAVDLVVANGAEGVNELDEQEQVDLGRNILQTADGNERAAKRFLLSDELHGWPQPFLRGLLLECFANEKAELRFKTDRLKPVMRVIERSDKADRDSLSDAVVEAISTSTPKHDWLEADDFIGVQSIVDEFEWAEGISVALSAKKTAVFPESGDTVD